jgi:hypothetical protein
MKCSIIAHYIAMAAAWKSRGIQKMQNSVSGKNHRTQERPYAADRHYLPLLCGLSPMIGE